MNNILEVRNINKKYYSKKNEVCAIEDISLDIHEGEYVAIVGPSGCGKSTLLNIIGGIDKQTGGLIKINGNKKIGYMLQSDCLFSWLNILDNCLIGLKIRGELSEENVSYVKDMLHTYGLSDFMYSYPSSLSGGMRQRVVCI